MDLKHRDEQWKIFKSTLSEKDNKSLALEAFNEGYLACSKNETVKI